jgi:hypothetical protein
LKILVLSLYHFNTETIGPHLEVLQQHLLDGDEVEIVTCKGELTACQTNPFHSKMACSICTSMHKNAFANLQGDFKLTYLQDYQNFTSDYDFAPQISGIEEFKKVNFEKFDIGAAVVSSVVSVYRDADLDLASKRDLVEKFWNSSIKVYKTVQALLKKENYDRVYVFNARFASLRACLRACQEVKTDCYVLEAGSSNESYSVFKNAMPHSLAYRKEMINNLWDLGSENKTTIAKEYFERRFSSKISDSERFTGNQEKGKLPESWDWSKKNIVIFNSSEDEFASVGVEWENPVYTSQLEGISKIVESLKTFDEYKVYVRIHPNLTGLLNDSVTELFKIKSPNLEIILPDSNISTYQLMQDATKVISFGSSAGIEAAAMGKISILAGTCFYKNLGSTYNPKNHEELTQLVLNDDLHVLSPEGAWKYANMLLNFGIPFKYYTRINPFEGYLNGKKFSAGFLLTSLRKLGRWWRLRKVAKEKEKNRLKVHEIAAH